MICNAKKVKNISQKGPSVGTNNYIHDQNNILEHVYIWEGQTDIFKDNTGLSQFLPKCQPQWTNHFSDVIWYLYNGSRSDGFDIN